MTTFVCGARSRTQAARSNGRSDGSLPNRRSGGAFTQNEALVTAPVSSVAPAREISIVFGTILGVQFFHEPAGVRRVAASMLMLAGIVAIALG